MKIRFLAVAFLLAALFTSVAWAMPPQSTARRQTPAAGETKTLLPDGRVLVLGGQRADGTIVGSAAIMDPQSGLRSPLSDQLTYARAWHSATVLPNGTVLVLGGIGVDSHVVSQAEVFDPTTSKFQIFPAPTPKARAFHSATLLTDGRLLIAGGVGPTGSADSSVELWDPRGANSVAILQGIQGREHSAALLSDGRVLFGGGKDINGAPLSLSQIFDPSTQSITASNGSIPNDSGSLVEMKASSPEDGAEGVGLDVLISARFSRPALISSINSSNVVLEGPDGSVPALVVGAESGMLAFITPTSPLEPGTTYSVKISGVLDLTNQNVAFAQFVFTTAGDTSSATSGDETWNPTPDWKSHRNPSKFESLPDLQASRGETAISGQVLRLNGLPLAHVTLQVNNIRTQSDETGRFLLRGVPSGHQVLVIEGKTASTPGRQYGRFEWGAEVRQGATNPLGFKIWMPLLDTRHAVTIPYPITRETIVTTPTMPGLELHIPANTFITDSDGKPVTKITITPIPLDQTPFPLPFVQVPIYFTIQPGGAYIDVRANGPKGARLFYPNAGHLAPGIPFAFWNYSADQNGWYVYGQGEVNATGSTIVPDPGVVIYEFSGAMVGSGSAGPDTGNPAGDPSDDGDPVKLSSGLFVYTKTDLVLPDVIPLSLTRTYRQNDSWSRPFGIGTSDPYEMFIGGNGDSFGGTPYVDLVLPDGSRIHFTGVGPGPNYTSYLSSAAGTPWYGAIISSASAMINPNNYPLPGLWHLQTKDGTIYSFPESDGLIIPACQALVGITDRYGNQVTITRSARPACTISKISSPNGRYITFTYDSSNRITSATDNIGRVVQYTYDGSGRLATVTDANNGLWTYAYDSSNRMLTITDPRQITYLTNQYDAVGRVILQTQADGSTYQFAWTPTANTTNAHFGSVSGGGSGPAPYSVSAFRLCSACSEGFLPLVAQVDVTDPNGNVRRVVFNPQGYTTTDTRALGKPEQETTTYSYWPDNLPASITDSMGRVTALTYDVNANVTAVTRLSGTPNAVTTTTTYTDLFSKPLSVRDALNNATNFSYDGLGNVTSVTDPLGHSTSFTYDGEGHVVSVTDPMANTTQFTYDLADLINITDPQQNTIYIFSDGAGRVVSRTDPLGHTVKYQYNPLDQITQIADPLQGVTSFTYDPNGNLLSVKDANQQTNGTSTQYAYNNMDRLQTRTDPLLRQESYAYDANGNLTTATDRRGKVTTIQYDGLNRRTFVGYGTTAGPSYESTISYAYDSGNRLTTIVDSSSGTITPVFDNLNRLTSETTPQGSISYTYDNAGRRLSSTVTGQPTVNYTYDNANRLIQVAQGSSSTSFAYDNAGRRTSMTLPNGITVNYGYDSDSRISSISYQTGLANVIGTLSYVYDAAGRRTQVGGTLGRTNLPATLTSASYDVANELTSWNGTAITYDADGNMANDGTASYTWNARNQLIGRGATAYQYDAYGRRTLNSAGNNLLYDGADATQESSGGTPVANRVVGGPDEFFTRTDGTGTYTPITDALGSVLGLADSTGNIVTQYTYDPFGNTTASGAANGNVHQYTGRENDGNGLYYYRARYYSPGMHRFVSEDPIGFVGGNTNLYAYVGDSPTNLRDPSGKSPCVVGALGGIIIYNGYQVYNELSSFMAGRKIPNAGWSGAWNILSGSAQAAMAGCMIGDGAANLFGPGAAEAAADAAETAEADSCALCFPAKTPVRTRRGLVPIETIKVGDEVLSRDRKSGKLEFQKVSDLIKPHPSKLLEIRINSERYPLRPTPGHPFFVKMNAGGGNWVRASQLLVGDSVLTRKGTWTKVTAISALEEVQTVYNFEVDKNHDYFAGRKGVLVHNGVCDIAKPIIDRYGPSQCFECATDLANVFADAGYSPNLMQISYEGPGYLYSDLVGDAISMNGQHVAVEVNGMVFDNFVNGAELQNYVNSLQVINSEGLSISMGPF